MIAAFRNGERIDALPLDSRAAHYGDGAFTTMRVHAGRVVFWTSHRQRLIDACRALRLLAPDWSDVEAFLSREAATRSSGVFKLALVPQADGRGYARAWPSPCDVYLFVHDLPGGERSSLPDGLDLATTCIEPAHCRHEGIKTLSRLDQVLIAPESPDRDVLACDRDRFVLAGRSGNVFALFGTAWATPPTGRGVIAGVMRSMLLQSPPPGFSVRVQVMHRDALDHADAVILCNAVRGLMPVRRIDARVLRPHAGVAVWMHAFHPELGLPET